MKNLKGILTSGLAVVLSSTLMFSTVGCTQQQTVAELISSVGTAVASLEVIEGNTSSVAKIQADTQAASSAVLNWKAGTPDEDVIEALNLVESDLKLFPISAEDTALIDLAIGTVDQIITLLPQAATPATLTAARVQTVKLTNAPKNKKDFAKQWNAILAVHPELQAAKVK